jgi:hypothetical protein
MPEEVGLDSARHRNLQGREHAPWFRRAAIALLTLLPIVALLNLLGQEPSTSRGQGAAAALEVDAPKTVRGGLLFQSRFDVQARQDLKQPVLHLAQGWLENLTMNTLEPAPVDETWRAGGVDLAFAPLPAGERLTVYVQYQVNPTAFGSQNQDVTLLDGDRPLAHIDRTIRILP